MVLVAHHCREILVIHPGALGDVLQAVPALTALQAFDGGSRLTFAGQTRLGRFFVGTGLADRALSFDGLGLEALFTREPLPPLLLSRFSRFDRVVSWFGSRAEPFPERLRVLVPEALVSLPVPDSGPPPTVWEHLLATLSPWGVTVPPRFASLSLPEAWRGEARRALAGLGWQSRKPLLVVHPGAGGASKRWPAERFARVIRQVASETGCQVLIHQGPADGAAVEQLIGMLELPVLHLTEPPLWLLAAVLREAGAYLGADSGVSHLAAATGAPAVILFSPATRGRWAPWSPTALPLTVSDNSEDDETIAQALSARLDKTRTEGVRPASSSRERTRPARVRRWPAAGPDSD